MKFIDVNKYKKQFWRGLYRTIIDIEVVLHRFDLWLYRKVDYSYFVNNKSNPYKIVGITRQPFRARR